MKNENLSRTINPEKKLLQPDNGKEILLKDFLVENNDYAAYGGFRKPILLKSGAEKLQKAFGLEIELLECVNEVFDRTNPYIDVTYKCKVSDSAKRYSGICEGTATSEEPNFKYKLIRSDAKPGRTESIRLKAEGKGKWMKVDGQWFWYDKIINPDILGMKNTIKKIAQKRAYVGAVIMATGTSGYFSQI
jgi:hypothetical protein